MRDQAGNSHRKTDRDTLEARSKCKDDDYQKIWCNF